MQKSPTTKQLVEFNRFKGEQVAILESVKSRCVDRDALARIIRVVNDMGYLSVSGKKLIELKQAESDLVSAVHELAADINAAGIRFDELCQAVEKCVANRTAVMFNTQRQSSEEQKICALAVVIKASKSATVSKQSDKICGKLATLATMVREAYKANPKKKSLFVDIELTALEHLVSGSSAVGINSAIDRVVAAVKAGRTKPKLEASSSYKSVIQEGMRIVENLKAEKEAALSELQVEIENYNEIIKECDEAALEADSAGDVLTAELESQRAESTEILRADLFTAKSLIGQQIAEIHTTLNYKSIIEKFLNNMKADIKRLAEHFSPKDLIQRIEEENGLSSFNLELYELIKEVQDNSKPIEVPLLDASEIKNRSYQSYSEPVYSSATQIRIDRLRAVKSASQELAETRAIMNEQNTQTDVQ